MNVFDFIKAFTQWVLFFAANVILDLMGLVIVAVAIPFRVVGVSVSDGRLIFNLPRWAHLWGNDFDGLTGDSRGWWANNTPFGWDANSYKAMYWWAAIRNPTNNMRMYPWFQAPIQGSKITYIGDYEVGDKVGKGGWQFVKLVSAAGKSYYGFYFVYEYNANHCFYARFGFKISPDQQDSMELPKGQTVRINPWKSL